MAKRRAPGRPPITAAEAGRRAWKGTTKAERQAIMRERATRRWNCICGHQRNSHWNGDDFGGCSLCGCSTYKPQGVRNVKEAP